MLESDRYRLLSMSNVGKWKWRSSDYSSIGLKQFGNFYLFRNTISFAQLWFLYRTRDTIPCVVVVEHILKFVIYFFELESFFLFNVQGNREFII
jgi:hypothetical protein